MKKTVTKDDIEIYPQTLKNCKIMAFNYWISSRVLNNAADDPIPPASDSEQELDSPSDDPA